MGTSPTPGQYPLQDTGKKPSASQETVTKTMPRNPTLYFSVLQKLRLLSRQLSGFILPGVCVWGWCCHHHTASSCAQGPRVIANHSGWTCGGLHHANRGVWCLPPSNATTRAHQSRKSSSSHICEVDPRQKGNLCLPST